MARPQRHDVDYFPFIVKDGRTLFILEGRYGCKGTGFFTNLLRFLAQTPDHWFSIKDETDKMMFFTKVHCDEISGMEMIDIMVKTGKLDKDLWQQKQILASADFLKSIEDAYRKRETSCITLNQIKEINSIKTGFPAEETRFQTEETGGNGITGNINPQSKEKKSKEKENKEKALEIIKYLNDKKGSNYSDISFIESRLKDGKLIEDFKIIIDNQIQDPYFIENPKYLNPETLFRKKNWDKYLNNITDKNKKYSQVTAKNIQSFQNWEPPE